MEVKLSTISQFYIVSNSGSSSVSNTMLRAAAMTPEPQKPVTTTRLFITEETATQLSADVLENKLILTNVMRKGGGMVYSKHTFYMEK